ncbi:MAG: hypothetical protein Q8Q31_05695 [Nanoarchaeota archaeon]|nr:hypothetical protein [Nanoarchaeota archaeon]
MNAIVVSIGIIVLILSALAYAYTVTEKDEALGGLIEDEDTKVPYRSFAFPLLLVGLVLIIIGAFLPKKKEIVIA